MIFILEHIGFEQYLLFFHYYTPCWEKDNVFNFAPSGTFPGYTTAVNLTKVFEQILDFNQSLKKIKQLVFVLHIFKFAPGKSNKIEIRF